MEYSNKKKAALFVCRIIVMFFVVPEDTEIKIEGGKTMNENQEATVFKGLSNKSGQ